MGDHKISIATTPNGLVIFLTWNRLEKCHFVIYRRADAVTQGPDNELYFIEPYIEQMSMRDLLTRLADQGLWTYLLISCFRDSRIHRCYFRHLLSPIAKWQPLLLRAFQRWKSIPVGIWTTQGRCTQRSVMVQWSIWSVFHISDDLNYAPIYVDRRPDAVNLWIGNGRSTTSIHSGECVFFSRKCRFHHAPPDWSHPMTRSIREYLYGCERREAFHFATSFRWLVSKRSVISLAVSGI